MQSLAKLSATTALFGLLLQGSLAEVAYGQDRSLTLTQQINRLQIAVCQQDWQHAVALIAPIVTSSQLTDASRSEYVRYRQTLQNYQSSNARFESMPGCEQWQALNSALEAETLPNSSATTTSTTSNFDWERAVRRFESQRGFSPSVSTNIPVDRPVSAQSASTRTNPLGVTPEIEEEAIVFKPSQGIFFYNSQFGNPAKSISGYLVSTMQIAVDDVRLVYDIYSEEKGEGVNAGVRYEYSGTDSMSVTNRSEQGQQSRFGLNQEGEFYRIVGIGWLENGERAYTFLHQSEGGQSGVCSQLWSYGYSCSTARQAKNPGF